MPGFIRKHRILLIITALIICSAAALLFYRASRTDLLNKAEYSTLAEDIHNAALAGSFASQQDLSDYITSWADSNQLEYKLDTSGNIIFVSPAVERKKKISPTVICVSYNYLTASHDAEVLAGAAAMAQSHLNSGRLTVVFVNDELCSGQGYTGLSSKIITDKSKVIYLDSGSTSYISTASFARKYQTIKVRSSRPEPSCDTAVRVRISGIDTAAVNSMTINHPVTVTELGALLSRLKSKSAVYQLADFEVGNCGSMYPTSIDATIMLNSYAVPSFTKYIDKRIKAFNKKYSSEYEELAYTYEVIDDPDDLPEEAYSRTATEHLTNVLYTLQSGTYAYEDAGSIPEGSSAGDIYGINTITGMSAEADSILLDIMTQARDEESMQIISDDNTAVAELFSCSISDRALIPGFSNSKDSLLRTFRSTYFKVNSVFNFSDALDVTEDDYFTPCSYIAEKNAKADIIHIRVDSDSAAKIINTLLCYIAYKGNILF